MGGSDLIGLLGILVGLGVLIWFAFKGWSVLLLAPLAAVIARVCLARADPRALDPDVHAQRGGILRPVLSALSARRPVRQADGRLGLGHLDRQFHDRKARRGTGDPRGRPRRRRRHLRRRQPVRRLLRHRADGAEPVPRGGHSAAPDAGGDHAGHGDLHHVGDARHALDPEHHSDALLRHHAVRGARVSASSPR